MNRRTFLGAVVSLPLVKPAMAKPTEFPPCTCGDFEPGPMTDTNSAVQCLNCRSWMNAHQVDEGSYCLGALR